MIASFTESAQDHLNLSEALNAQVAEALKIVEKKTDEAKKKASRFLEIRTIASNLVQQSKFFQRLLSERDRVYADRIKVCVSMYATAPKAYLYT